ncbi:MAG: Short-chain dehydrogenase, partial [Rhodoferax sp.]|nr:Short-chain dehydrogenase [Rhodoferax sp.]
MKKSNPASAHPGARTSARTARSSTVDKQRRIQRDQDAADRQTARTNAAPASKTAAKKKAPDTGAGRPQPVPLLSAKRLKKPGVEAEMSLRPRFEAPAYQGSEKLKGFSTLITGGDSGIGRAVAVLFAREGANVAIVYLNEHGDAEETKRCVEKEGRRCLLIPGDVCDARFCNDVVKQTVDTFGRLDVLVNNAAFQEHAMTLEDITEEHFDLTMRTNLYGYFHMAKAALPHLKPGASIINSGSETGLFGHKMLLDYATTKGGIHAFTKSLATNLVSRGIRVNAVA